MVIFWYIGIAIVLKNCESWLLKILGKQYLQMSDDSQEVIGTIAIIAINCCIDKQISTIIKHTNFIALCYYFVLLQQ